MTLTLEKVVGVVKMCDTVSMTHHSDEPTVLRTLWQMTILAHIRVREIIILNHRSQDTYHCRWSHRGSRQRASGRTEYLGSINDPGKLIPTTLLVITGMPLQSNQCL